MGNDMLAGTACCGCSVSVSGTAFKLQRTRIEVLSAADMGLTVWLNNGSGDMMALIKVIFVAFQAAVEVFLFSSISHDIKASWKTSC